MQKFFVLFCFVLLTFNGSYACSMENISNWLLPVTTNIYDTERDVFFRRSTSNIEGINSVTNSEGLNGGPYLTVSYSNSEFTIAPNTQFENYEENETEHSIGVTVNFRCSGGSSNTLVFVINIIDTNNNAPQFRPSDNYLYKVAPPLPPGFLINDCVNNIIVRDIDLTTQRIDFEIEENPFFEIVSDTSTTPKEFKATLRTTTFIRRISEPIVLRIKATDVDLTGDPPITSNATVRIEVDTEFEFPDDLIFSQTFYIATYTIEGNIRLENDIYLQQGYDANVHFSLEGDKKDLFYIDLNENRITLRAVSQLPTDLSSQIYLILKASREHTSGATATIVVNLPEGPNFTFEDAYYKGLIVDNSLRIQNLVLQENTDYPEMQLNINSEFTQYFTASVQNNNVILRMDPLTDKIIKNNNILTLQVVAIANNRTAATVVILEIIKDDRTTPIFEKNIYNATYDPILGVTVENITFIQGFDETVTVSLEGDFKTYFQITQDGDIFNIITTGLPSHVLNEQRLLLTIIATKPRTVGAQAVLYIAMPEARALAFKSLTYSGYLVNNSVVLEQIELNIGYDEDVVFDLSGDYARYFLQFNEGNLVTLSLSDQIPESVISDNNILIIILTAEGNGTEIARTTVVLDIIKQDTTTPMFNKNIYHATYLDASTISIENIYLKQGFDENVTFHLSGDNAQYFAISYTGNNISISLDTIIPEELIFNEKVLLFNILAEKPFSVGANAAISVHFPKELTEPVVTRFSKHSYTGNITNEMFTIETIVLDQGFQPQTEFLLIGDLASIFSVTNDGNIVTLEINEQFPEEVIENKKNIILNIEAIHPRTIKAHATIVIEIISELEPNVIPPVFERAYYYGEYSVEDNLQFNQTIQLREGHHENISFELEGESSIWFSLTPLDNGVILTLQNPIPSDVLADNQQLIFIVTANVLNSTVSARSTIVIALIKDNEEIVVLGFNKPNILGTIDNNTLNLESISLVQGFSSDVVFTLQGELESFFSIAIIESTVTIQLEDTISDNIVPDNRIIILELVATAPKAIPAYVTIVIEVVKHEIPPINDLLKFTQAYYIGAYDVTEGLNFSYNIILQEGYDETVQFTLVGENSLWFGIVTTESGVTINLTSPIPIDVINNNRQLIFEITASKLSSSVTARSAIIITMTNELNTTLILGFEKNNYLGTVDNVTVNLEPIILVEGFTAEVEFSLNGELANLFTKRIDGAMVYILLEDTVPDEILSGNRVIVLELEAKAIEALSSYTTIVLEIIQENNIPIHVLKFKEPYYTGQYKENDVLEFEEIIALTEGRSDGVEYSLEGDNSIWFSLEAVGDGVLVILSTPIPQNIQSENMFLVFIITATKPESVTARSTIVISLTNASEDNNIYFDKLLYRGVLRDNIITHENILVSGYNGTDVEIFGDHVNLFVAHINQGLVTVGLRDTIAITVDSTYVILEIRVPGAGCVLQLDVIDQEIPALPTVRFSSESYVMQVDISQTGLIGQVSANADNGESITYSLSIDNDQLKEILSINSNGELHLTASISSGVHTCRVVATTDITQVNGTATVILIVESGEEIGLPPLIIIEKDEESPYNNLVTLNTTKDCRYEMTNHWPIDQKWLYVDDYGLHTNSIDREDKSIAFMALSQIQVELTLQCDIDKLTVQSKSSFNNIPMKSLGSYDYGTYRWVLTDPILYNPRRSFVNLIVNDINDNDPIFDLKENEPIAVGYPLPELEEIVPPRALVELTATDADIGENAALVYWSSEPALAVSPTTGRVHISNSSLLQQGAVLRVSATDRNGVDGRTGHIDLMLRLLDVHQIAVVTVQDAFLEDEIIVLTNLTNALGYEVKALRSVIMPMDSNDNTNRKERAAVVSAGALLRLFIYGLINREPVEVSRLTSDINSIVMGNIASTVSLKDHLESREICSLPARDTGLLAATIALSILLFIIIVVSAVWFFLKWRKTYKYNNFSDQNSLASRDQIPPTVKIEEPAKPRMNIEELKRSERRLQDILDAPETSTQNDNVPQTVVDVPTPDQRMPIVIQSIDKLKDAAETSDEDEFGETQKARRKSVVTFNENVEKIIHLEDTPSDTDYEVYKF
ncbi:PREDICTED: uncharacterized protein LOC106125270 [Papilio xuthus]|uniref:Uncharacterized protein LOC106125270 n=1 Tax=Papilio xuthus TaxID=66420 RepID=A0AAJ7EHR4_PAPXU|nr:PREDICTED: uncharacterized protein LOC106125270 [Papilio xuthus]